MLIGQERVHRIVCTAYHGEPEGDRNVVDHIDTNRCNNRPENLRWVTKLENTLLNPITRAKVELICGSVEAFIENPSLLYGHESENPNFIWMRSVTKEEGQRSLKRWKEWAAKPKEERKPKGNGVGEWIYEEKIVGQQEFDYGLKESLTPGAKQLDWKTPNEFPQIPQVTTNTPLQDYLARLPKGAIFTRNRWGESPVYDAAVSEDGSHLAVLTEISGATNYALSEVTFENGFFVHKSIRTFFTEEGAQKYFSESLGREWTGGDVFEDYC